MRSPLIELPPVVYKYRDWSNPLHKRLLNQKEVNFAAPIDCQEHHECNLPRDFDSVTDDLLYQYYYNTAPNFGYHTDEDRKSIAKRMVQDAPMKDERNRRAYNEHFRATLNRDMSIFCVSPFNDKINLWESFADSHMGFCVGFDTEALLMYSDYFASGGFVNYYDISNPPKIRPFTFTAAEALEDMMKVVYSLPDVYQEEHEYRFAKMYIPNRQLAIDAKCFREIVLGSNMSEKHSAEICEIVKENFPEVELLQATCDIASEKFEFNQIAFSQD